MKTKSKVNSEHDILTTIVPLVRLILAYLAVFVLYSGLIGSRIISGGILYTAHYSFYGGLGKSVLFAAIAFIIMAKQRNYDLRLKPWKPQQVIWLMLSIMSYIASWIGVNHLLAGSTSWQVVVLIQSLLVVSLAFAGLGGFGLDNLKVLIIKYRQELVYSLALLIAFYGFLTLVYGLWQYLASIVLYSIKWLLDLTGLVTVVIPPRGLLLTKFGINIAEYCSGIESIALFTGLYALIGTLDWHRLNIRKFLLAFPVALVVLFGFNILRVYVLILVGYYINPTIAFNLFHTYAGMLFFIVYSAIFWKVAYKWMLKKQR